MCGGGVGKYFMFTILVFRIVLLCVYLWVDKVYPSTKEEMSRARRPSRASEIVGPMRSRGVCEHKLG